MTRRLAPYVPRIGGQLPMGVPRDLVFAPDLVTTDDPITGKGWGGPSAELDGTLPIVDTESREFNGTTDRIDYDGQELAGSAVTWAAWVRPDTVAVRGRWWASRVSAVAGSSFAYVQLTNARVGLLVVTDATAMQRIGATSLTLTSWVHVAITKDASLTAANSHIYINGVEDTYSATTNGTGTELSTAFSWHVGGRFLNNLENFDGGIRQLMIWKRQLSTAEIATLAGLPRPA